MGRVADEDPELTEGKPPSLVGPERRGPVAGRQGRAVYLGPFPAQQGQVIQRAAAARIAEVDQPGHGHRFVLARGDEDMVREQFAVAQHRRAVAARRHRFGEQALRPADLRLCQQPRPGQRAQVVEPVRQVGRLQGGIVGELEAPVGVAAVEPADRHRVQPGDDLSAGAGRGPALTG